MNDYISVEFGGKERGLKFNQLALEEMTTLASTTSTTANVYAMFYGGLVGNQYVKTKRTDLFDIEIVNGKETEVAISFENVCDWVDQLFAEKKTDVIKAVEQTLTQTQLYKSLVPEKEEKKRLRKAS